MPLRDHFRPPVSNRVTWEEIHGMWPAVIVQHLRKILPPEYFATPKVRLGPYFEIDIGSFELDGASASSGTASEGGTAPWTAPTPTATIETALADTDEYEVRIYSETEERRLVAAIELVSPGNKDRLENRHAFVSKCVSLLRQGVSVTIVDVVTIRQANLYAEMLDFLAISATGMSEPVPGIYAVACRWLERFQKKTGHLQTWIYPLAVGEPLPTLPLWLSSALAVPFDLEQSYEATCEDLRLTETKQP